MIRRFFRPGKNSVTINIALFVLRVATGAAMLTHGWPKFQRLLAGNLKFGDQLGIGSELSFILVVFGEFACSILLILGLLTRFASMPLAFAMLVAFAMAHADDPFSTQEKPFLYFVIFVTLLIAGPGKYSLDQRIFRN